jgi:NDP-sugar pyrophosphorylase family protein
VLTIVVPIAGEAKRFADRGYTFPKPLIEIEGRPMIEIVVGNVTPAEPHRFVFVCRAEHLARFALTEVLALVAPGSAIVPMAQPTAGALCSVLLAAEHIASDDELLIVNGDQYVEASVDDFLRAARGARLDGSIMTFPSTHPKWSYARVEDDEVVAVAEKRPISRDATVGIYYFKRGGDFLAAAERMILKEARSAGEFYVAPVYNELILAGRRIGVYPIARERMHSLGTPEDVERFAVGKARELT